jgi:hypothetical protein
VKGRPKYAKRTNRIVIEPAKVVPVDQAGFGTQGAKSREDIEECRVSKARLTFQAKGIRS